MREKTRGWPPYDPERYRGAPFAVDLPAARRLRSFAERTNSAKLSEAQDMGYWAFAHCSNVRKPVANGNRGEDDRTSTALGLVQGPLTAVILT